MPTKRSSEEGDRFIRGVIKLLFFNLRGGAASKVILGCWVVGVLSEQEGLAKNSLGGVRGAQRDRV